MPNNYIYVHFIKLSNEQKKWSVPFIMNFFFRLLVLMLLWDDDDVATDAVVVFVVADFRPFAADENQPCTNPWQTVGRSHKPVQSWY